MAVLLQAPGRSFARPVVETLNRLGPLATAAVFSVALSMVAIWGALAPNDDGMLYVEVAQSYQTGGLEAARALFDWVFLSILIAGVSSISGLQLETAGYLISTVLLAGTCLLLVACVRTLFPQAAWAACAVVLALPGLNNYRDYIIREFGAWFFIMLALLLLLRWRRGGKAVQMWGYQLAIAAAALFRVESLIFLVLPVVPAVTRIRYAEARRALLTIVVLPLIVGLLLGSWWATSGGDLGTRMDQLLAAIDLERKFGIFDSAVAEIVASSSFPLFAMHAESILFLGLQGLLLIQFLENFGVFLVPAVFAFHPDVRRVWRGRLSAFLLGGLLYLLLLSAYLFEHLFMTSRYVVLLNLMAVPLVALGVHHLWERFHNYRWVLILLLVIAAFDNVVSSRPEDVRYRDAAAWLVDSGVAEQQVHFEDPEMAYLAGMSVTRARGQKAVPRDVVAAELQGERLRVALLDLRKRAPAVHAWVEANGLSIAGRFRDRTGGEVVAVVRRANEH